MDPLSEFFYDPLDYISNFFNDPWTFWGVPLILALVWEGYRWLKDRLLRTFSAAMTAAVHNTRGFAEGRLSGLRSHAA